MASEMLRAVRIVCEVVRNGSGNGFLPIITVNGWRKGNTYQSSGYDHDDALALARQMASEERERYSGDWDITIEAEPVASRGKTPAEKGGE